MKSVYLHVNSDADQEASFLSALDVVRTMSGHLTCLQINPIAELLVGADPFGAFVAGDLIQQLTNSEKEIAKALKSRLDREGVPWDWIQTTEEPRRAIPLHTQLADLIVVRRDAGTHKRNSPSPITTDIMLSASAPVLVVPPGLQKFNMTGVALVAWNGSPQAAQALRAALPMLRLASVVHIVTVEEMTTDFPATDASVYLSHHGIKSNIRWADRQSRDIGPALLSVAAEVDASCLVMGCYGHSKVTEYFLGGATRHMLTSSPLPLLMAH